MAIEGGADLRADAVVDFSSLGADFANILPSVSTKILIDFGLSLEHRGRLRRSRRRRSSSRDITLDLGSFISKFAGPILDSIKQILDPLAWLIGPDGFLNKRIPLLSDLAGNTITGADLVDVLRSRRTAPTIKAFLTFVHELYHLVDLVHQASSEGDVKLNFGDIMLVDVATEPADADPGQPGRFIDSTIGTGRCFDAPLDDGAGGNLANLPDLSNVGVPDEPRQTPSMEGAAGAGDVRRSRRGRHRHEDDRLPAARQPVDPHQPALRQAGDARRDHVPELSFNFYYMQEFPIIGPLVGTFDGGLGAKLDLRLGYDTQGLADFIASGNPAELIDGFFFDTQTGDRSNPLPVATLDGRDRRRRGDRPRPDQGRRRGRHHGRRSRSPGTTSNNDGKVRLDEMASNILANGGDPLAVFDISGEMRASSCKRVRRRSTSSSRRSR